ncbi:MAG: protein of unknown function [Nitrospira sp.]
MSIESSNGTEAITGKLIRARRQRMQMALRLFLSSGVIRLAKAEPPHARIEAATILPPTEPADHVVSTAES